MKNLNFTLLKGQCRQIKMQICKNKTKQKKKLEQHKYSYIYYKKGLLLYLLFIVNGAVFGNTLIYQYLK